MLQHEIFIARLLDSEPRLKTSSLRTSEIVQNLKIQFIPERR